MDNSTPEELSSEVKRLKRVLAYCERMSEMLKKCYFFREGSMSWLEFIIEETDNYPISSLREALRVTTSAYYFILT